MTTGRLVIIAGKAGSGKTTLSKSLAKLGFTYVSASSVLRYALGISDRAHDKHSLAEHGGLARGTPSLVNFHNALLHQIDASTNDVVLDGPRFSETIGAVQSSAAYSLLVYLDCPDKVRRQRLASQGRSSDWAWLEQHPTEISVAEIREMADLILDGAQPTQDVLRGLVDKIQISGV